MWGSSRNSAAVRAALPGGSQKPLSQVMSSPASAPGANMKKKLGSKLSQSTSRRLVTRASSVPWLVTNCSRSPSASPRFSASSRSTETPSLGLGQSPWIIRLLRGSSSASVRARSRLRARSLREFSFVTASRIGTPLMLVRRPRTIA